MTRLVTLYALMASVAAGCSGEAGAPAPGAPADPSNDIEITSSQPFAGFPQKELTTLEEVRRKLAYKCMVTAGYREYDQADPEAVERPSSFLVLDRELVGWATEAHARSQGFGNDVQATPVQVVSFDTGHDAVLENCVSEAEKKLGPDYRGIMNRTISLRNEMSREYPDAFDSARFKELNSRVIDCLADADFDIDTEKQADAGLRPEAFGITPGGPEGGEQEPHLKREAGTIEVVPASPARRYVPSMEEAKLAVATFSCQKKDRNIDDLRALVNAAQQAVWTKHEDELSELKPDLGALITAAAKLL